MDISWSGLALWYVAGWIAMVSYLLFNNFYKKEEITIAIKDLVFYSLMALGGFLLWLTPIVKFTIDIIENYDKIKDIVIWKNRRAKNKEILFGDDENDDKTYPKL